METDPDQTPDEGGASGGTQPEEHKPADPWPDQEKGQRDPDEPDIERPVTPPPNPEVGRA
jgi:hypothetical protein